MEQYVINKIKDLSEKHMELVNKIRGLYHNNILGMDNDKIDKFINQLNRIQKEIRETELKISPSKQRDYYNYRIKQLKEEENKLKNLIKKLANNYLFGIDKEEINFLKKLHEENNKNQIQIENLIYNFIDNSNKNTNTQSIIIKNSPSFKQSQNQSQTIYLEIQGLIKELETEIKKENPNLQKIISLKDIITKKVPEYLPFLNMIINLLQKFGLS